MDAVGFDDWYERLGRSPRHRDLQQRALGLPPQLESTSLLPWDGIADLVAAVRIDAGDTVLDLGCGRGGYGLEIARRTGARLIGVDFSAVAITRATELSDGIGEFRVGELTASGLPDASVDVVVCVDAMQFAEPYAAGLAELARVLRPGGRVAVTGWQAHDLADEDVPARLRIDIGAELAAAGFEAVEVRDMRAWSGAERALWTEAAALDPGDDPGLQSMHDEGVRVLRWIDRVQRVLAVASTT